ncbi:MAG: single-stranded DNA-binding protein [Bdellovibrio sp.]|nr:single-stranded DNA-binding protein [Bdellovibrio sp.]
MDRSMEVFVGRLGKNPELRYTPKQTAVCSISLAVDKEGLEAADWKRVVVWGRQAEICSVQLKKGSELFVQGRKELKTFQTKDGETKTIEEINAKLVGFSNL